jgi:murein DD-endopeptidase MepM/ murein hydrolase activator NlpD
MNYNQNNNNLEITDNLGVSKQGFIWPIKQGIISSYFGLRKRKFHDGIDIKAPKGTHIYAAKSGRVLYSAKKIKGYGNMIVIQHPDYTVTVYAHNSKNLVKTGDFVNQGDLIGHVGRTGRATGPHLHFEIRKGVKPVDPLLYLSKPFYTQQAKCCED